MIGLAFATWTVSTGYSIVKEEIFNFSAFFFPQAFKFLVTCDRSRNRKRNVVNLRLVEHLNLESKFCDSYQLSYKN